MAPFIYKTCWTSGTRVLNPDYLIIATIHYFWHYIICFSSYARSNYLLLTLCGSRVKRFVHTGYTFSWWCLYVDVTSYTCLNYRLSKWLAWILMAVPKWIGLLWSQRLRWRNLSFSFEIASNILWIHLQLMFPLCVRRLEAERFGNEAGFQKKPKPWGSDLVCTTVRTDQGSRPKNALEIQWIEMTGILNAPVKRDFTTFMWEVRYANLLTANLTLVWCSAKLCCVWLFSACL